MKVYSNYSYKIIIYTLFILFYILIFSAPAVAYELVRAELPAKPATSQQGVFDDGAPPFDCASGDSVEFDYADDEDTDCDTDVVHDQVNSDVSGGGRWHFNTYSNGSSKRYITVDFSMPQNSADCAILNGYLTNNLDLNCGCGDPCSVQVWIQADRLFKKSATRQSLGRFDVVGTGPGPDLRIDYVNPLYICEDSDHPKDKDWRLLQSESCDATEDVSLAEVSIPPVGSESGIVIGRWSLPFFARAQRVAVPADGGGSDPGGCTDADGDGYCLEDGDCDDNDPNSYPGHNDTRGKWGRNGIDNDCNGVIDG